MLMPDTRTSRVFACPPARFDVGANGRSSFPLMSDPNERKSPNEEERPARTAQQNTQDPGKPPGSAESGGLGAPAREKPYPNEPGKTPGKAEGSLRGGW